MSCEAGSAASWRATSRCCHDVRRPSGSQAVLLTPAFRLGWPRLLSKVRDPAPLCDPWVPSASPGPGASFAHTATATKLLHAPGIVCTLPLLHEAPVPGAGKHSPRSPLGRKEEVDSKPPPPKSLLATSRLGVRTCHRCLQATGWAALHRASEEGAPSRIKVWIWEGLVGNWQQGSCADLGLPTVLRIRNFAERKQVGGSAHKCHVCALFRDTFVHVCRRSRNFVSSVTCCKLRQ